jgi:hypothetical protein
MGLHEYSVFARFRYNDLKVSISSGNEALKRCAFLGTNPTGELITVASGGAVHEVLTQNLSQLGGRDTKLLAPASPTTKLHSEARSASLCLFSSNTPFRRDLGGSVRQSKRLLRH